MQSCGGAGDWTPPMGAGSWRGRRDSSLTSIRRPREGCGLADKILIPSSHLSRLIVRNPLHDAANGN